MPSWASSRLGEDPHPHPAIVGVGPLLSLRLLPRRRGSPPPPSAAGPHPEREAMGWGGGGQGITDRSASATCLCFVAVKHCCWLLECQQCAWAHCWHWPWPSAGSEGDVIAGAALGHFALLQCHCQRAGAAMGVAPRAVLRRPCELLSSGVPAEARHYLALPFGLASQAPRRWQCLRVEAPETRATSRFTCRGVRRRLRPHPLLGSKWRPCRRREGGGLHEGEGECQRDDLVRGDECRRVLGVPGVTSCRGVAGVFRY